MSTICADPHKPFPSHPLLTPKKHFKDLEIPPRKLIPSKKPLHEPADMSPYDSPTLHKYLHYHGDATAPFEKDASDDGVDDDDDDLDPYSSDHFRMYEFKVRRCTRSRSHDWTDCPFAHPGEKARRRDPRRYHYSGTVCPEFRRGGCSRGDNCEFAHGVFECWLHPSRYRTEACKDGRNCKRKVCFFAHTPRQLRILPEMSCPAMKYDKSPSLASPCRCLLCHSVTSSPTSTLLGMSHLSPPLSPSLSPPMSPVKCRSLFSPTSRLSKLRSGVVSYKDVLTELMNSLEAMNFNDAAVAAAAAAAMSSSVGNNNNTTTTTTPWIDTSFGGEQDQPQFILSPSTSSDHSRSGNFLINDGNYWSSKAFVEENNTGAGFPAASPDPDLGWVNDLLM